MPSSCLCLHYADSYVPIRDMSVLVYVCILFSNSLLNSPTVINIPPQDTTVFLNRTGMFSCETSGGDFIVWRVNGTSYENLPSDVQSDVDINPLGTFSDFSTLTITARAVYNGTTIQCVTLKSGGIPVESENVTLTIQGIYYK